MTYIPPEYRRLGPPIRQLWDKLPEIGRETARKIMLHTKVPSGSGVTFFSVWNKRSNLIALHIATTNLAKTEVETVEQVTALYLYINREGEVTKTHIAKAKPEEIERYCKLWPQQRELIESTVRRTAAQPA